MLLDFLRRLHIVHYYQHMGSQVNWVTKVSSQTLAHQRSIIDTF